MRALAAATPRLAEIRSLLSVVADSAAAPLSCECAAEGDGRPNEEAATAAAASAAAARRAIGLVDEQLEAVEAAAARLQRRLGSAGKQAGAAYRRLQAAQRELSEFHFNSWKGGGGAASGSAAGVGQRHPGCSTDRCQV